MCHPCGAQGGVLDLVRHVRGGDIYDAAAFLLGEAG